MLTILDACCFVFVCFRPFRRNSLFKCSPQPKTQKSLINSLFYVSGLFKVADFGVD